MFSIFCVLFKSVLSSSNKLLDRISILLDTAGLAAAISAFYDMRSSFCISVLKPAERVFTAKIFNAVMGM